MIIVTIKNENKLTNLRGLFLKKKKKLCESNQPIQKLS
jgi:hypothetical protein